MGMLSFLGNDISCVFRGTFSGNKYEECIIIQQHLLTIFLQTSFANTMPVETLFLTSLIIFPNFAPLDHPLIQLSQKKLLFETAQNSLSRDFCGIFHN